MNLFVFSDESGVFDYVHNDYFVFGGIVFLSSEEKEIALRKYLAAERSVRREQNINKFEEVKAATIPNKYKGKLFRSLNNVYKFGAVVEQKSLRQEIFNSKKTKQRYLDYTYKIAIKRFFQELIATQKINPTEIENIFFYVDEHTTATNGKYELREALEEELKNGTFNFNYNVFYPPVFPNLKTVNLEFCNSASKVLIRASDIVANHLFFKIRTDINYLAHLPSNFIVTSFPSEYKTKKKTYNN